MFETLPWPQAPTAAAVRKVAEAAVSLRKAQGDAIKDVKGGLRKLYSTFDLPGKNPLKNAHAVLDAAVLDAYGFSAKKDILQQLLDLNQVVASNIAARKAVTGPGIPASYPKPSELVSTDCIGA